MLSSSSAAGANIWNHLLPDDTHVPGSHTGASRSDGGIKRHEPDSGVELPTGKERKQEPSASEGAAEFRALREDLSGFLTQMVNMQANQSSTLAQAISALGQAVQSLQFGALSAPPQQSAQPPDAAAVAFVRALIGVGVIDFHSNHELCLYGPATQNTIL